jgi:Leu/Phe-tRNA-protein transferase
MINVETLEIKYVNELDVQIEDLWTQRESAINCRPRQFRAYYDVKRFIESKNYTHSVSDCISAFVDKCVHNERISCTLDVVVTNMYKELGQLVNLGYS